MPKKIAPPVVMTIGHSTRSLEEFTRLLQAHGATRVVDVRTVPRSWHNPQFNKATQPRSLKKSGLGYFHVSGFDGLRHARHDSPNVGWRKISFRGYADYMRTALRLKGWSRTNLPSTSSISTSMVRTCRKFVTGNGVRNE